MVRFRTNKILEKNQQGKKGIGIGLVYPSAEAIEIIGMLGGFDFVNLDGELEPHGHPQLARADCDWGATIPGQQCLLALC